jgi:amino acid adenylation domain-containing protein
VLPLDASYPAERLAFLLADSGAGVVVAQPGLAASLPAGDRPVLVLDGPEDGPPGAPVDGLLPESLAWIVYTSGSAGEPKASGILHRALCNFAASAGESLGLGPGDGMLQFSSPGFDAMLGETVVALTSGAALCLGEEERLLPGPGLTAMMRASGVTAAVLPPTVLAALDESELPDLRVLISAGEACTPELRDRWSAGRRFLNAYGPSEATITVTWRPLRPGGRVDFGRAIPNLRMHLLDGRGEPVPVGVPGEICLAGLGLARGYLGRPALTAERFVPDPFGGPGERLYRSGDLARLLPDGTMEFAGRADHQVKLRGFRVELGEIEAALAELESVGDAVVAAREEGGVMRLVAYVVPAGRTPRADELREQLSRRLPEYMVPAIFVTLDRLPLLANGKVDRKALPAPAELLRDRIRMPPRNPVEAKLASLWAEVLRLDHVGVHDNFFELGGDSILSIQIVARAREAGLFLTPRQVFQHQTIAELAGEVGRAPSASAEQGPVTGPVPLTQIQRWFIGEG